MGRLWLIGWQWAVNYQDIPRGLSPDPRFMPNAPDWEKDGWLPTALSDQWQLAAICYETLTGEKPSPGATPPLLLMRPDCPAKVASVIDRALSAHPGDRFPSVASMVREVDRIVGGRGTMIGGDEIHPEGESEEARLRWALGDDYEVLAALGRGSFGSVWRVRDLSLGREVALKLLAPARRARRARRRPLPSRGKAGRAARASGDRSDLRLGQPRRRRLVHDGAGRGRIRRRLWSRDRGHDR